MGNSEIKADFTFTMKWHGSGNDKTVQKWRGCVGGIDRLCLEFFLLAVESNENGGVTKTYVGASSENSKEN